MIARKTYSSDLGPNLTARLAIIISFRDMIVAPHHKSFVHHKVTQGGFFRGRRPSHAAQ
jgi:hypothetical protein